MDIEEGMGRKIVLSIVAVVLFIVSFVVVGTTFGVDGELTETGGLAMLGALVGFILLMGALGLYFASLSQD
ncbi:hypothetical protein B4589_010635 [Halolamina sp. CBA1230]|uniref:DUF7472 family protein n=1 Tax=Halolamina sp. CBA1230 TaxID=1853690 RepID=UPI0009A16558|nr:hypothetical protein [Halolamina sp. CBA1230]QKY20812.1 hypothetical protein B4589_010635 [Halolamina sp. CBA1230]